MIYHVSKKGSDHNPGSEELPFATIQNAAELAVAGDKVVVHEGVYRESVHPCNGGQSDTRRIVYEAAKGEHVAIKGSERITGWQQTEHKIWSVKIPNSFFGTFNPYQKVVSGDWLVDPNPSWIHLGDVYLNGTSLFEVQTCAELKKPQKRTVSTNHTWGNRVEALVHPEESLHTWYTCQEGGQTVLCANFGDHDPNTENVEINVRETCFFPARTGIDYITVRGFEMAQAATQWAPPTAWQKGMLGPNWSKGWIIENNILHDAKCCAVSLGKENTTGDNEFTRYHRKAGYHYQMEAVFLASHIGWRKERVGSHIVRNNRIYRCGQAGIVGHMGCIFSKIYQNDIFEIAKKHEFWGHEIGGIKLHAAIDVEIAHNHIHHCSLGTWLDWQAQGARVTGNVYDHNNRDLMIEVTHGPYLVDNNIFASAYNFDNAAQGGAYLHNLCCGFMNHYSVLDRATPYHLPHSTDVLGTTPVYGDDDRWYQNLFVGGRETGKKYGTADYNGCPHSLKAYIQAYLARPAGDLEAYAEIRQPAYIDGNVYLNGADAYTQEQHLYASDFDPKPEVEEKDGKVYLQITLPPETVWVESEILHTKRLAQTRITDTGFEAPDGSDIVLDSDMTGALRTGHPLAGPLQNLQPGKNRIEIWRYTQALSDSE